MLQLNGSNQLNITLTIARISQLEVTSSRFAEITKFFLLKVNICKIKVKCLNQSLLANGFLPFMTGLYLPNDKPWSKDNFEWTDGSTDCTYRIWNGGEPNGNKNDLALDERFVVFNTARRLADNFSWEHTKLFCKEEALTTEEWFDVCRKEGKCT